MQKDPILRLDFAEMWLMTCSYLCQHDRIEKIGKIEICIFAYFRGFYFQFKLLPLW